MISETARRDLMDTLTVGDFRWWGRLSDTEFLSRLCDLEELPSTDYRQENAAGDISLHREHFSDWQDDWVFLDTRFNLLRGTDESLLLFLCECLHPAVRPSEVEAKELHSRINGILSSEGFELFERSSEAGRPVFSYRKTGLLSPSVLDSVLGSHRVLDADVYRKQIERMLFSLSEGDVELAIGSAKELVESCCKTILEERHESIPSDVDVVKLVKLTTRSLSLTPADIVDTQTASETIRSVLGNLAALPKGIAALRNCYGSGHGKPATYRGLTLRHAKLAVGAAFTLAVFLIETHLERPK